MAPDAARRVAMACGVASPAVAALGIGAAMIVAPSFDFSTQALSDLGVTEGAAPLFNGSLLLAGLLGLGFAWFLWTEATDQFQRAGAVAFAGAVVGLAGVGAFPAGTTLHRPSALSFYGLATYALFLWGTGLVRTGATTRGLATLWLGVLHVTAWLAWGVALVPLGLTGVATPETAGAAVVAWWTVTTVRRHRRVRRTP